MTHQGLEIDGWSEGSRRALRQALLSWYHRYGRELPWRMTLDPYAIWVSEIMLQQTQVKTVLPYYQKWLEALPQLSDLAQAPQSQVLKLWEGLGYYRRALNLHRSAMIIQSERHGQFPQTYSEIIQLPGIGRTTAGGILSAAFNLPLPILDGNVKRVLSRLMALPIPPTQASAQLWALSEALLDRGNPRDFNQALMDLGATLCRRRYPRCDVCPWQHTCQAYVSGQQHLLPRSTPMSARPHKVIAVGIVLKGELLLIDQRLETSMLGGLWEFPGGKIEEGETPAQCVVREIKEEIGIDVVVDSELTRIEHEYSHFTITLLAYICRYVGGEAQALQCADVQWIYPDQINNYAFPSANQKLFPPLYEWLKTNS